MLSDRLVVIDDFKLRPLAFECIDIEMVGPKLDHALLQLAAAVDRAKNGRLPQCADKPFVVLIEQQTGVRVEHIGECAEPPGQDRLFGQSIGRQLFFDIGRDTEAGHAGHITRARAVGQTAQEAHRG